MSGDEMTATQLLQLAMRAYWGSLTAADKAAVEAISQAGFAIVPIEPTEAMEEAARDVPFIAMGNGDYLEPDRSDIYRAMIQAGKVKP